MATLTIRKADGSSGGSLELNDAVFAAEANPQCVRAAVNAYLAAQRAGTHNTKTRAFVSGGGKKPYKQKGTGRARQGSTRAPQWRHGAIIFGPSPRDYTQRLNKKVRQGAVRTLWSEFVRDGRLIVVDSFGLQNAKTKELAGMLGKAGVKGTALLVTDGSDEKLVLAARNLAWAKAAPAGSVNVYDLINHDYIVATADAVKQVEATYA